MKRQTESLLCVCLSSTRSQGREKAKEMTISQLLTVPPKHSQGGPTAEDASRHIPLLTTVQKCQAQPWAPPYCTAQPVPSKHSRSADKLCSGYADIQRWLVDALLPSMPQPKPPLTCSCIFLQHWEWGRLVTGVPAPGSQCRGLGGDTELASTSYWAGRRAEDVCALKVTPSFLHLETGDLIFLMVQNPGEASMENSTHICIHMATSAPPPWLPIVPSSNLLYSAANSFRGRFLHLSLCCKN